MPKIHVLDQNTINQIAAGEVIERPMAVVKELVENAIDAQANAITVEVKDGGKELIRITDNGTGIAKEDIVLAFTPHATSKIKGVEDLLGVSSLGFRETTPNHSRYPPRGMSTHHPLSDSPSCGCRKQVVLLVLRSAQP